MAERKIPTRMCVGCGEHKAKNELIRVVRTSSGVLEVYRLECTRNR